MADGREGSEHSTPIGEGACRGVACYARTSAQRAALSDENCGVNHHSVALPRIAGVARYAPTEEGKERKEGKNRKKIENDNTSSFPSITFNR